MSTPNKPKYYLRPVSDKGNWNNRLSETGEVRDVRDNHEIDINLPYYAVVDSYGNRVYGIKEGDLTTDPENIGQYAVWQRSNLPEDARFNAQTGRYEAVREKDNSTPSLQIFDNGFYTNPSVVSFNNKMDLWKRENPGQNFIYDLAATGPVLLPILLTGTGAAVSLGQAAITSPVLTGASFLTGVGGGYLGNYAFDKYVMQPFTPYSSVGEFVRKDIGYPEFVGETLNPGGAVVGGITGMLPIGMRNFLSNGGVRTASAIAGHTPQTPATPTMPDGWLTHQKMKHPPLLTNYIYGEPRQTSIRLSRSSNAQEVYRPIENLYSETIDLKGNPTLVELSTRDPNVTIIPNKDDFLNIHFGTSDEAGVFTNYQGVVEKAGNPSTVGRTAGIRAIADLPSGTYYGPDPEVTSWMRRLDTGETNKFQEVMGMFLNKHNPTHEVSLTPDGWKLNSRQTQHSYQTVSDNGYVSLKSMKEHSKTIIPGKFGEDFYKLADKAQATNNLKELNEFLRNNKLPEAYFLDGELRLPVIQSKTK